MPRTNKEIKYNMGQWGVGEVAVIPKGTACIVADNLPADNDAGIAFWAMQWAGMTDAEESHQRTYGFGIAREDVDAHSPTA